MKFADYALLFLCVLIPIVVVTDVGLIKKENTFRNRNETEKALSCGVNSAVCSFDINDGGYEAGHNPECIVNEFFSGMASVLGKLDDPKKMEDLKGCVPIICVMYEDGFFIRYIKEAFNPETGYKDRTYEYTELKPYYFRDAGNIYVVKNSDFVIEYNISTGERQIKVITGTEMEKKIEEKKTQLVNGALEEYCSGYGLLGSSGENFPGIGFSFSTEESSEFERAMPDKGIIAVYHDEYIPYIISAAGISG